MSSGRFYDWSKTFSFNADVTMVIAHRGRGKTFGLRAAALDDVLDHGYRFVEIARHQKELPPLMAGYFDKLQTLERFSQLEFRTEGHVGYYREQGTKPWKVACYFVALSEAQNAKKRTYAHVRKLIYDEALVEPGTYLRYLPREYQTLINVVDTCTREIAGEPHVRPHLYMCANSCDMVNPFFIAWGIDTIPPFGYSWHMGKTVLLHYEKPGESAVEKASGTLAGRMASRTDEGVVAISNEFNVGTVDDIAPKPSGAKFWIGIVYRGDSFGVWTDFDEGYLYVTRKIPKGASKVYSLTRRDNTVNRLVGRRATPALRALCDAHYERVIRFDTIATREKLLDALAMFGVS